MGGGRTGNGVGAPRGDGNPGKERVQTLTPGPISSVSMSKPGPTVDRVDDSEGEDSHEESVSRSTHRSLGNSTSQCPVPNSPTGSRVPQEPPSDLSLSPVDWGSVLEKCFV